MKKSSEIAFKFKEERLPPIPGLENDQEVRAVIALHLERTMFSGGDTNKFKEAIDDILEDFGLDPDEARKRILSVLEAYGSFLKTVIGQLHEGAKKKAAGIGSYSYKAGRNIYFDNDEFAWVVDLERLQESEAKYDDVNLFEGQVIAFFDPKAKDPVLNIHKGDIRVRTAYDNMHSAAVSSIQQKITAAAQCTCGNTPCTCGAIPDDTEEEPKNEFEEWDKIMSKATDRDVILVYQDGEEKMRF